MKGKLLIKASELFSKRGVRDVNVDDICHSLGISKKTFYQYYTSKENLIAEIVREENNELQEKFISFAEGKSALDILFYVFTHFCRSSSESERKIRQEIRKYYPDTFRESMEAKMSMVNEGLRRYYDKGVDEGVFRGDLDYDSTITLFALLHKSIRLYIEGDITLGERTLSMETLGNAFMDMVIHGILTPRGLEEYNQKQNNRQ